jgi:hypothetical protein
LRFVVSKRAVFERDIHGGPPLSKTNPKVDATDRMTCFTLLV